MHYILVNETHLEGKNLNKFNEVLSVFDNAGIEYEVLKTQKAGDAKRFTEEFTSNGEKNTIVAMGGDGTLHDVINGFNDFDNCDLGIIPFGTGNDFAEGAGIPLDTKAAAEVIANGTTKPVDFIQLASGLRSINSVGMGIDVDVLKRTYASKDKGKGKYLKALIVSLKNFESVNFTIKYDGKEERHFGLIAAVGNGGQFGGGIKIFPHAKIDDGLLDVIIVDYISKARIPAAFAKLMRGKVDKIKKVSFVQTKAVTFINDSENFTIQAEGELYDNVPIEAHIVEGKLKLYLP
ncbi:MAG: diacylglycerol kinase family lipid kinase [Clostridia bacterium]|nr:diacylglycerol kinase family lipid kinase [Clostridia bacterium]